MQKRKIIIIILILCKVLAHCSSLCTIYSCKRVSLFQCLHFVFSISYDDRLHVRSPPFFGPSLIFAGQVARWTGDGDSMVNQVWSPRNILNKSKEVTAEWTMQTLPLVPARNIMKCLINIYSYKWTVPLNLILKVLKILRINSLSEKSGVCI